MKKVLILVALVCAIGGGYYYFKGNKMTADSASNAQEADVRTVLTAVYAEAKLFWTEDGKYPPSLETMKIDPVTVQKFNLKYQPGSNGQSFLVTADVDGQRWTVDQDKNIVNSSANPQ